MQKGHGGKMGLILNKSCEDLSDIQDEQVSLIVTSPPYWNAIDYDSYIEDKSKNYRNRNTYGNYISFVFWLAGIFNSMQRVLVPGGYLAIVAGTILFNKKYYPFPYDLTTLLVDNGWEFHQDIIWHKCTGGVKRAGVTIQNPYPGYYYPNIMHEYILIFKKPGDKPPKESGFNIGTVFKYDIANTVWHIASVPPNKIDHPTPFPEEIPYRLIKLYTNEGDTVLDPFCGSGTTLKVAKHLNRDYIGYDIIPEYIELTKKRLEEPLKIRKNQLIAKFDLVENDF